MKKFVRDILFKDVSIAPLAMFRVIFGFMMLVSNIRFLANGWVDEQYLASDFQFSYFGFEWVEPFSRPWMYLWVILIGVSAMMIMFGLFYRIATIVFFITFTYAEFIDLTYYLNHYYFVSLVAFLMIFLPANRAFSLDASLFPAIQSKQVKAWTINLIKFQLGIVYFYAGVAKLHPDWLIDAMPLRIWLPARSDMPVFGFLLDELWVAYLFSWFGCIYDLTIPFLLLSKKTRRFAYFFVVVFHVATYLLFQIGMFPFIMILSTLIFFPAGFHQRIINWFQRVIQLPQKTFRIPSFSFSSNQKVIASLLGIYVFVQLLFPFRYAMYPGQLFWNEEGYRFSWRVMLMEKAGYASFTVKDPVTGNSCEVDNSEYLLPVQEKMMSTQPDLILQFAHFLKDEYSRKGIQNPEVYVRAYVTLNGQRSRLFIDPGVNLAAQNKGWAHKTWVLNYE